MNFLKKLFKRSSDEDDFDEDDDVDFDDDDDSDDAPRTQVIDDEDDDLDIGDQHADTGGQLSDVDVDDDTVTTDGDSYDIDADNEEKADIDDDNIDFDDDEDIDFDDDDDYDDDDDDETGGGGKRKIIFIAAGVGVLLLGIVGGGAFWFLGDDPPEQTAQQRTEIAGGVQMALPPRSGSLNALGAGEDDKPSATKTSDTASEQSASEQATSEQATSEQPSGSQSASEQTGSPNGTEDAPAADSPPPVSQTASQISSSATLGSSSLNSLAGSGSAGQGIIIPSVTSASYRAVPDQPKATPLANAPDRRLLEAVEGLAGPLPSTSKDGRRVPWEVYARPLTGNEKGQRVGVLVTGLGLSRAATMAAINKLPGEVSLVFEPYAKDLDDWLLRARLAGHEVFVALPMESADFPAEDPGPLALTTTLQVADNMKRLHGVLSSFAGYVGVVSAMGSKFSTAEGQLKPILAELKKRGLMFVDGGAITRSVAPRIAAEIDLPRAKNNLTLDEPPSPGNISRKLRQLEKLIKDNATAIATIRAYPSSINKIAEWTGTLSGKQLALVPVSAIANKQFIE